MSEENNGTESTNEGSAEVKVEQGNDTTQQKTTDDLLTRVSKFVLDKDPANTSSDNQDSQPFNSQELEATISGIEDPVLKSKMEGLRKSLVSGANNKFQEIATLRKEMQELMESSKTNGQWTPERVQQLANDPKFIEAAQQVAGTESGDEYSSLSEAEQSNIKEMKEQIKKLEVMNTRALQTQQQQLREQQHTELTGKYANYDKKEIDAITYEVLEGKIPVTPEHMYKAFKHDDNVKRAYELGRKDEREGVSEKIASTSAEGIQASSSSEPIVSEKGESSRSFFNKLIAKNLKLHKATAS